MYFASEQQHRCDYGGDAHRLHGDVRAQSQHVHGHGNAKRLALKPLLHLQKNDHEYGADQRRIGCGNGDGRGAKHYGDACGHGFLSAAQQPPTASQLKPSPYRWRKAPTTQPN